MKILTAILLLAILFLPSCYTQKRTYLQALSSEEKEILEEKDFVITNHKSYHKPMKLTRTGKLRIVKDGKEIQFIHIGRWVEYEDDGFESVIENYDEDGNPIDFTNYDFKKNLDVYIKYYKDSLDGNLIQFDSVYRYFPSGKIKESYTEYRHGNKSIKHGYFIKFDSLGTEVSRIRYDRGKK